MTSSSARVAAVSKPSFQGLHWIFPSESMEIDPEAVSEFHLSPAGASILAARGLDTSEKIRSFLRPELSDLSNPLDFPEMDRAVARLIEAQKNGERVCVFSDYDVDGISGGAQLVEALRHIGVDVFYYIPHRFQEGYGLNASALQSIRDRAATVVITVDCGISNLDEVAHATKIGLDLIITDHHTLPPELPAALARVHPKQIAGPHPSQELSGSGVAFKLACAVLQRAGGDGDGVIQKLIDLAALGTLADMVPMRGENRILATLGLRQINLQERPGIRALCDVAKISGRLTEWHVLFLIGPRLNAAGRLYEAKISLELLLERDLSSAHKLARELQQINSERRAVGEDVEEAIYAQIAEEEMAEEPILLLVGEGWHPGVVGIAAARVAERFRRPAVVLTVWENVGRASARTVEGVNVFEILSECRDLFASFGGHAAAAGFTIDVEKIPELRIRLREVGQTKVAAQLPEPTLSIDAEVGVEDISMSLAHEVEMLAPFGEQNEEPVFLVRHAELRDIRSLSGGKHVKLLFSKEGRSASILGFRWGDRHHHLSVGDRYDVAFNLRPREWNGYETAEARLVDLRKVS